MKFNSKFFKYFGIVLLILQIICTVGTYIITKNIDVSPIIAIIIAFDFYFYMYLKNKEPEITEVKKKKSKKTNSNYNLNKYDALIKLKELLDKRIINNSEFEEEKKKILEQ